MEYRAPALLEQSRRILAIPAKRTDTRLINYLTLNEVQALLNVPDLKRRDGIRDRAIIHLCFSGGNEGIGTGPSPITGAGMATVTQCPHFR